MEKKQVDVIVVGLGISGLMITYLLSKQGKSVLAFEKEAQSASYMTGTYGTTRCFGDEEFWPESEKVWKQLEKETECELLTFTGGIQMLQTQDIHKSVKTDKLREQYPNLVIPDKFECFHNDKEGVIYSQKAIDSLIKQCTRNRAKLFYKSNVVQIQNQKVTLDDGMTFTANSIVVCTQGKGYLEKFNIQEITVTTVMLKSNEGLPEVLMEENENGLYYGQATGENLKNYKVGEMLGRGEEEINKYINQRFKNTQITEVLQYHTLVDKDRTECVTICDEDKEEKGIYYLFAPAFRTSPHMAQMIIDMINEKK